jgi:hypothetical protein
VAASDDPIASAPPSRWAVSELQAMLQAKGVPVRIVPNLDLAPAGERCLFVSGGQAELARRLMPPAIELSAPESLVLASGKIGKRAVLLACGSDARGLVYAVLELADRVRFADNPLTALEVERPIVERPANVIRSIARCFVSELEDKPWFYDQAMWREYLSMLATQRYNRFSLTLGIGYDTASNVTDSYFLFPYPFLISVPGYDVRVKGLPEAERARNLEMLRFISDETAARGLHFQLGLWTHSYDWPRSPKASYPILGLTPETQAVYCRDALAALLRACPAISGLTLRVHSESGVPSGSQNFWQTLFEAARLSDRRIELDLHAKEVPQETIAPALATGMPVNLSPKYWAEHMGLPYHQAAIRHLEMAKAPYVEPASGVGGGSRSFTRYGYADLLREDRPFGVLHRIWPGTQRFLLWGDPVMAAAYGRASSFCGSLGVELFEPLSFKGRQGSGQPGGRCAYADGALTPRYDWEKYLSTYRIWGRLLYNPQSDPEVWRRCSRKMLGRAAPAAEAALANASRILPLLTTAHGPSAANAHYWPEVYTDMPLVNPERKHPYPDTPAPKRFGAVSPFDPQFFSSVEEFAAALLTGEPLAKYSPAEVAQALEALADTAARNLVRAERQAQGRNSSEFRRLAADVFIQVGLGRFFAWKLRAAALWSLHERSGDFAALREALKTYRAARAAWAELAERAASVYVPDIAYGQAANLRGHWQDRLAAIDLDIADMQQCLEKHPAKTAGPDSAVPIEHALREVLAPRPRPAFAPQHEPAERFRPGEPLQIALNLRGRAASKVVLHYRRVNQAERWQTAMMREANAEFRAQIPASCTQTQFPLQYYMEINAGTKGTALYPGLGPEWSNQPYFVVRHAPKS